MALASAPSAPAKPRVFLMGMRRCGKSSIQKVVFHKMSPHETLFLEGTSKIVKTGARATAGRHASTHAHGAAAAQA